MITKKILVKNSERDMVVTSLSDSDDEKLDILNFVLGNLQTNDPPACNEPPDYRAYADGTYIKASAGTYRKTKV